MHMQASLSSTLDYSPFGMVTPGRSFSAADGYRFGFNGKESDAETYGSGNIYDYGFRIYNPRLGKFLSVDPLTKEYAWYTPYQFAGNKPIAAKDLDGLEEYIVIRWYDSNEQLSFTSVLKVPNKYQIAGNNGSIYFELSADTPEDGTLLQNTFGVSFNRVGIDQGLSETAIQWSNLIYNDDGSDGNGIDNSAIIAGDYQDNTTNGDPNGLRPYERDIVNFRISKGTPIQSSDENGAIGTTVRNQIMLSRAPITTYFANDVAPLNPTNVADLTPMINALQLFPSLTATIEGNTDDNNTDDYNLKLGMDRALATRDFLISQGIDVSRLETQSNGEAKPTVPNTSDENRALNRNTKTRINYPSKGN